ncbi:hypothetical protein M3N64_08235 [Sporolactobacillus sp. CPB3-1]|uniref:Uncharacterized protein n=1 Tax=Sporolactobacillus mangiferae TaxID=2940498 RepID=A0ABT0MAN5_9BACL|nr:hypothetical protein [Sporolactobacillus mangiferae]MCL1631936.1 hypothetical protein [Sporolactobacillus mangiferae]
MIIINGQWVNLNARQLGVDKKWVVRELEKSNIHMLRDVLIAECGENRKIYTIKKEKKASH